MVFCALHLLGVLQRSVLGLFKSTPAWGGFFELCTVSLFQRPPSLECFGAGQRRGFGEHYTWGLFGSAALLLGRVSPFWFLGILYCCSVLWNRTTPSSFFNYLQQRPGGVYHLAAQEDGALQWRNASTNGPGRVHHCSGFRETFFFESSLIFRFFCFILFFF